jgi:WD40 repeat protein
MNQDVTQPPSVAKPFKQDFSHLPKPTSDLGIDTISDRAISAGTNRRKITTTASVGPNNYRPTESSSVISHAGAVSAISFGVDGHHLVSTGQDNLKIWDLRASNGFMVPLRFLGPGQQPAVSRQEKQVPLLLTPDKSFLGQCWIGNRSNVFGYSLDRGGTPRQVLEGHLSVVTAIDTIEATMQLLTAGNDGMILTWSSKSKQGRKRKVDDHDTW